jgi:hypothetical protein
MNPNPIPTHWSAEQALAVCEVLQQLSEQIWTYYRIPLIELLGPRAEQALRPSAPATRAGQFDLFDRPAFDDHDQVPF